MEAWDVVVIGSGVAALRAAIAASDGNATVTILSSQAISSSSDSTINCGFSIPMSEPNHSMFTSDTIRVGSELCEADVLTSTSSTAVEHLAELERWGLNLRREGNGLPHLGKLPGQSAPRTASTGDSTVEEMLLILQEQTMKRRIPHRGDVEILDIVLTEGGSRGLIAMDIQSGELFAIQSKAIILADSGFEGAWNGDGVGMGTSAGLALQCALPLVDLEFTSMHPLTVSEIGLHISLDVLGAGAIVTGNDGTALSTEEGPDSLARAIVAAGGATLDLTPISTTDRPWFEKTFSSLLTRSGIDGSVELIPIMPMVTATIGGIPISSNGQVINQDWSTQILGLFAAGDSACSGLHGASINSGDRILSSITSGAIAGATAADYAATSKFSKSNIISMALSQAHHAHDETLSSAGEGGVSPGIILQSLSTTMQTHMGSERNAKGLESAAAAIQELSSVKINISDRNPVMNTEMVALIRTQRLLSVASAAVSSAIARKESRGSHIRTDFPDLDSKQTHHTLVHQDGRTESLSLRN